MPTESTIAKHDVKIKHWIQNKTSHIQRPMLILVLTVKETHIQRKSEARSDIWQGEHFWNSYTI